MKKIAELFDRGICLHRSRYRGILRPYSLHPCASRPRHVHIRVVSYEDGSIGHRAEALQGTAKDLWMWFADAFGVGYQDGVEGRLERQALQFPALHSDGSIRDQPELESTRAKGRQRPGGIREQGTGARKSSPVVRQQGVAQVRGQVEPREDAGEQVFAGRMPVAVELDGRPNVLPAFVEDLTDFID